jgi:hypothetical protein
VRRARRTADCSPVREHWVAGQGGQAPERGERPNAPLFFRPGPGALLVSGESHGLRHGLHSYAPPELFEHDAFRSSEENQESSAIATPSPAWFRLRRARERWYLDARDRSLRLHFERNSRGGGFTHASHPANDNRQACTTASRKSKNRSNERFLEIISYESITCKTRPLI